MIYWPVLDLLFAPVTFLPFLYHEIMYILLANQEEFTWHYSDVSTKVSMCRPLVNYQKSNQTFQNLSQEPGIAWFMSPERYIMYGINHVYNHSWGTGQALINQHHILLNVSKHHGELSSSLLLATFSPRYSFAICCGFFSCTSLLSVLFITQCLPAQSLSCPVI